MAARPKGLWTPAFGSELLEPRSYFLPVAAKTTGVVVVYDYRRVGTVSPQFTKLVEKHILCGAPMSCLAAWRCNPVVGVEKNEVAIMQVQRIEGVGEPSSA